jgi:CelD/BcsL family acetyltransferase involved in cellulose biosynthesis
MLVQTAPAEETATTEVTSLEAFLALREEWNALARSARDEPFHRHEFLRAWIESFLPHAPLRILIRRDPDGRLDAVLPLRAARGTICGVPVRQLTTLSNSHSCRVDLLARDPDDAGPALLEHLLRDRRWDVLVLKDIPEGGHAHSILATAQRAGLPVGRWTSQSSPVIHLPDTEEEMMARLDASFRRNMRRRRRRLEERGRVVVECHESGDGLEERLASCLAVEQGGWKGRRGTAILQDRRARDFYARLASAASAHGYFTLYCLRLDDRIIAFEYGLTYNGVYYVPKLAYDESLSDCGPGVLLLHEVMRSCLRRGVRTIDFLGDTAEWKLRWTQDALPHDWLFIFRGTRRGRALRRAKFSWLPGARRILDGLRPAWLRSR